MELLKACDGPVYHLTMRRSASFRKGVRFRGNSGGGVLTVEQLIAGVRITANDRQATIARLDEKLDLRMAECLAAGVTRDVLAEVTGISRATLYRRLPPPRVEAILQRRLPPPPDEATLQQRQQQENRWTRWE